MLNLIFSYTDLDQRLLSLSETFASLLKLQVLQRLIVASQSFFFSTTAMNDDAKSL